MRQRVRIFGGHAHKCMKLLDFDVCANVGTKKEERNRRNHAITLCEEEES